MLTVRQLLKNKAANNIFSIGSQSTVLEALELMAARNIGAVLVMEGDRLVGIFSERDYTRKVALQGKNSRGTSIAEIMTREVVSVPPTAGTRICMALMSTKKIRHLPVMDGDKVLGMISIRDIMDDIIADHEQTISQLQTYITG